jgi:hypothetical protein
MRVTRPSLGYQQFSSKPVQLGLPVAFPCLRHESLSLLQGL